MAKTLTIQIRSIGEALEGFKDTFKTAEAGGRVREREGVYFTSMQAARNLLTPNRLALLRTIRTKRPGSIYELAKMLRRDLKNVQGLRGFVWVIWGRFRRHRHATRWTLGSR